MLMLLITVLLAITWGLSAWDVVQRWGNYKEAAETLRINDYVDLLLQSTQNLAFERGRINVLLNAEGPAGKEDLDFVAARREAVSGYLDAVLVSSDAAGYAAIGLVMEEYDRVRSLRQAVDAAITVGKTGRDPALADQWFAATTALIDDLGRLAATLSLRRDRFTLSFRSYSRLKILAFELRDTLGIEASRIAASVSSGRPMRRALIENVMFLRGQSYAIWKSVDRERSVVMDAAVDVAVQGVEELSFRQFRPLQDEVLEKARAGEPSPVPVAQLTRASIGALDSIARLMSVLAEETRKDTARTLADARDSLLIHVALAFVSLIVGILAIIVVARRLLVPMGRIEAELTDLAAGNLAGAPLPAGNEDEMDRAQAAVAAFRASLIERRKLEERLAILSVSDGLTGLANRRRLDEALQAEWQRAARQGQPLALVMMDVDHFKNYNDRYGHLEGDQCLRRIASALSARAKRTGDLAARFGGEEFTVILPGLALEQATGWAETLRADIEALHVAHEGSELGVVTISCGVASMVPTREGTVVDMLRRADEALYRAKAAGRNRVAADLSMGPEVP
jgi:diguanylate cyclase (GGDEF)-like protein